jgi:recombination protein U
MESEDENLTLKKSTKNPPTRGKKFEQLIVKSFKDDKKLNKEFLFKYRAGVTSRRTSSFYASEKSMLDFYGHYYGKAFYFDAKTTKGKSFPFARISKHQLDLAMTIQNTSGLSFFIIEFSDYQEYYVLTPYQIEASINNGVKSVSLNSFREDGYVQIKYIDRPMHIGLHDMFEQLYTMKDGDLSY